jgi:hypothetical protein
VRIVFSFVFRMAAKRTVSPITRQQKKKNSEVPSKVWEHGFLFFFALDFKLVLKPEV